MAKYVIVKMLKNQAIGSTFNSGQWPLHITIIPNFEIDWDFNRLELEIERIVKPCKQIITVATARDLFGPNKDIPVTRLELKPKLAEIHNTIVEFLESNGAKFELPIILKDNYRPHVTVQEGAYVNIGENLNIDELCIVDKDTEGNPSLRKVLGIVKLAK